MKIGEAAKRLGVSTQMLKVWDRLGSLTPSARTTGGHRRYTDTDLQNLSVIRHPGRGHRMELIRQEQT